jgi:hypothetical protein
MYQWAFSMYYLILVEAHSCWFISPSLIFKVKTSSPDWNISKFRILSSKYYLLLLKLTILSVPFVLVYPKNIISLIILGSSSSFAYKNLVCLRLAIVFSELLDLSTEGKIRHQNLVHGIWMGFLKLFWETFTRILFNIPPRIGISGFEDKVTFHDNLSNARPSCLLKLWLF